MGLSEFLLIAILCVMLVGCITLFVCVWYMWRDNKREEAIAVKAMLEGYDIILAPKEQ